MDVVNNKNENRFELHEGDQLAKIEYQLKDNKIYLISTEVPKVLSGKGIGSRLVKESMELIEKMELQVVPVCSFIQAWFKRHPEKAYLQAGS